MRVNSPRILKVKTALSPLARVPFKQSLIDCVNDIDTIDWNKPEYKDRIEDFMNDRGEIRDRPFKVVQTKAIRNPGFERRIIEENRERTLFYAMLAGAIMVIGAMI